jgi:molybdate transport system permease protein
MIKKTLGVSDTLEDTKHAGITSQAGWSSRSSTGYWKLLALPLLLFIVIPLSALFLRTTFTDFFATLNQKQVIQAVSLSFISSVSATAVTLIAGTPVAYLLAQRPFRFHQIVDTIIDLPTVLPPSVAGVALLMAFGRRGLFGPLLTAIGINIPFTFGAVILAQIFVAAPFFVKAAAIGFAGIDPELKQAAALDGANRLQIFRYVTLPLSWMALVSGAVMTWARAVGEFGATILFAGNFQGKTQTMPLAIYVGFETDLNVALTLSIILVCFSFLTLIIVKRILNHRLEADQETVSM